MINPGIHIFITGSHRSGTTWIGRTIAEHPKVEYIHEPFNVDYPNPRLGLRLNTWFTHFKSSDEKKQIHTAFNRLLKSHSILYAINLSKPLTWNRKNILNFPKQLISKLIVQPRVLIKDPIALLSAGWLYETYNLQVICMIRKPLAFVGSLKRAGWDFKFENLQKQKKLMQGSLLPFAEEVDKLSNNNGDFIDRACLLWNVLHYRIVEYQRKYPDWLFLRYEDVATNPIQEFEKMFQYLHLEMTADIRKYITTYTSDKNVAETDNTSYGPRNSKESLKTWLTRLTPEECDRVKNATRDIAALFYSF